MSPLAEPESMPVATPATLLRQRLDDGEIIILAIRPSGWLVVLMSWPMLVGVAAVAAASLVGKHWLGGEVNGKMIGIVCASVALLRVIIACTQWLGRLYILTDRRVMRIKGVFREECYQCLLTRIGRVHLSSTLPERLVGVESLLFERTDEKKVPDGDWICLANPKEVRQAVEEAIRRAK